MIKKNIISNILSHKITVTCENFGEFNSKKIYLFNLSNGNLDISITNYGCTIMSIYAPDRLGNKKNIVAGFTSPDDYLQVHPYLGCVIGRFANRIAIGETTINGIKYKLPVNDGFNHLHGGINGFNRRVWQFDGKIEKDNEVGVSFSYISPDGEEGYPGCLRTSVTYILGMNNDLIIRYQAVTDKATIVNLTNHSYFNLSGFETPNIYNHTLQVFANLYTEKNEYNVPSGIISSVLNTPFDFRNPKKLGERIDTLKEDGGYDHNFVISKKRNEISLSAVLYEEKSGRKLKVFTDRPGIQIYTSNFWDGSLTGNVGNKFEKHSAVALETQDFPDAPNHPNFPNTIINPGEVYRAETVFQFLVE